LEEKLRKKVLMDAKADNYVEELIKLQSKLDKLGFRPEVSTPPPFFPPPDFTPPTLKPQTRLEHPMERSPIPLGLVGVRRFGRRGQCRAIQLMLIL